MKGLYWKMERKDQSYDIAKLTEKDTQYLSGLEDNFKKECGKEDIVLIAYQKTDKPYS